MRDDTQHLSSGVVWPTIGVDRTTTAVLIQARMGSSRLPGKVAEDIAGVPMWKQVFDRARLTGLDVQMAWPDGVGDEADVLGRLARRCRRQHDIRTVVRLTADCPLLDPSVVGYALNLYRQYGSTGVVATHPDMDGLDVEVFSAELLFEANTRCADTYGREHVTPWMTRWGSTMFSWAPAPLRWSVDTPDGLAFVRAVYAACAACASAVPHHTNAPGSIGGVRRQFVMDLHHTAVGDLVECGAADLLMAHMGGEVYRSE